MNEYRIPSKMIASRQLSLTFTDSKFTTYRNPPSADCRDRTVRHQTSDIKHTQYTKHIYHDLRYALHIIFNQGCKQLIYQSLMRLQFNNFRWFISYSYRGKLYCIICTAIVPYYRMHYTGTVKSCTQACTVQRCYLSHTSRDAQIRTRVLKVGF
jgi:hypothetical protein